MRKLLKTEHTRLLPHFHRVGATFFITTHLSGSIPQAVLKKLKEEREAAILKIEDENPPDKMKQNYFIRRKFFHEYDDWLDRCENSPTHLANPQVAKIMEDKIREYDNQYYNLVCYTLMPNHLHLVLDFSIQMRNIQPFDMEQYVNVSKVMNLIKGGSGMTANKVIGNTGNSFWSTGYYDRYIRNYFHYLGAVNYTINNVVKAKLCLHWSEHLFTWLRPEHEKSELLYPEKW